MTYNDLWVEQQWSYHAAEKAQPSTNKCCCCITRPNEFNPITRRKRLNRTKWLVAVAVGIIIGAVAFLLRYSMFDSRFCFLFLRETCVVRLLICC